MRQAIITGLQRASECPSKSITEAEADSSCGEVPGSCREVLRHALLNNFNVVIQGVEKTSWESRSSAEAIREHCE